MKQKRSIIFVLLIAMTLPLGAAKQTSYYLTLDECHKLAISGNKTLEQAKYKVDMAGYDKKIATANYFPKITASGTYQYNSRNLNLISDEKSEALKNMGTTVQNQMNATAEQLKEAIMNNPLAAIEYAISPLWQTVVSELSSMDVATSLNNLGAKIDESFHLDIQNVFAGAVTLQQPLFVGGKIINSNKMASLAIELAKAQYDTEYEELLVSVDQAYWQVVSVANKKKLAESYLDLLALMQKNAEAAVNEGVAVQSDLLQIKVKYNEAQMLLSKSTNGLALAKMLLCKQIGLPLDSDVTLSDETLDCIARPEMVGRKDMDSVFADRSETRSLDLAVKIFDKKVAIARSEMLPTIAATASYIVSNPNTYNGFSNTFGGHFSAGVVVSVPIFHGTETLQKTRKAKAEAQLYRAKYEDACHLINLQVEQLTRQQEEAISKLEMALSNLEGAEENLRIATVGFEEGVITPSVTLAAQTAWLKAHSEYIDAGIELQMNHVNLLKAQGEYKTVE